VAAVDKQRVVKAHQSAVEGAYVEKLIFNKRQSNFIRVSEQLKPYLISKYRMIVTFIERDE
jgi:hypothetical protein